MMPPSSPPNWPGVPPQPPTFWQRMRGGVARWWNAGLWQKVALLALVPVLVACTCCGGLAVFALTPAGQQLARETAATETAQTVAAAQAQATTAAYVLLHPKPTNTPKPPTVTPGLTKTPSPTATSTTSEPTATSGTTPTATLLPATGNPPRLGSPLADFIAAYGQPISYGTGNTPNFYTDSSQTTLVNVGPMTGVVSHIAVIGPISETKQETYALCAAYLPSDAVAYNTAEPYTDFHSGIGEIVLENLGMGTCLVFTV